MICPTDMCTGCMACVDVCNQQAISIMDNMKALNAIIDDKKCLHCGACRNVCQALNIIEKKTPIMWKQGWANDDIRKTSSSGGFATAIMRSFIIDNGIVYSCVYRKGNFIYERCEDIKSIDKFKGSKYVKSLPIGIYKTIREDLNSSRRVLFIGLPCHIAGLKRFLRKDYKSLYTIDLICHGSPSSKLLELFLRENGTDSMLVDEISFRENDRFNIKINGKYIYSENIRDKYTIGFLRGLFYTENCYHCKYASLNRISDLTIGDSWNSDLVNETSKGISLALCVTEKGKELINKSDLVLFDVNINNAVEANHQLKEPSEAPREREVFFQVLAKSKSFNKAFRSAYPFLTFKQAVKRIIYLGRIK